ncbi:hypothetical protein J6590_027287 [Homalodisca vitripennis]|nr:hypothetical protein J6590_027287 [Homalodisca vitripennis]
MAGWVIKGAFEDRCQINDVDLGSCFALSKGGEFQGLLHRGRNKFRQEPSREQRVKPKTALLCPRENKSRDFEVTAAGPHLQNGSDDTLNVQASKRRSLHACRQDNARETVVKSDHSYNGNVDKLNSIDVGIGMR